VGADGVRPTIATSWPTRSTSVRPEPSADEPITLGASSAAGQRKRVAGEVTTEIGARVLSAPGKTLRSETPYALTG